MKVIIGSDHGGFELKEFLKENFELEDIGVFSKESIDYPVIAKKVAEEVASGNFDKGIIVCGSGLGVAITANKVKGIRAVTCTETYCAKMSRLHNDANVLTLGGRVLGPDLAKDIVEIWLNTDFEGGRHQRRVDMIES